LSYNKIKHIKGVKHLSKLKELFFVQNGIGRIEELDGLVNLTSLELGANRIRVLPPSCAPRMRFLVRAWRLMVGN